MPIVAEQYGNSKYGVKHYAVAVVKKSNTGFNLKSLKGKNSCHSGARTVEGWNVPIGYMLREKIIAPVRCDTDFHDFYSAANFFEWSCVPGELWFDLTLFSVSLINRVEDPACYWFIQILTHVFWGWRRFEKPYSAGLFFCFLRPRRGALDAPLCNFKTAHDTATKITQKREDQCLTWLTRWLCLTSFWHHIELIDKIQILSKVAIERKLRNGAAILNYLNLITYLLELLFTYLNFFLLKTLTSRDT